MENMNKEDILNFANDCVAKKNFEAALKSLNENSELFKNDVEYLKLVGLCCVNLEKNDEALEAFEHAIKLSSEDATSWFYLGTIYDAKGMSEEAQEAFEKVISLREDYVDAYKNLALVQVKNMDLDSAKVNAKIAEKLTNGEDYQVYYILSSVELSEYKYQSAIKYLKKALELTPDNIQILNNLGAAYLAMFNVWEAEKYYIAAYNLDPENAMTNFNIGMFKHVNMKYDEALLYLEKAYSKEQSVTYLEALANTAMSARNWQKAINAYKTLLILQPDEVSYHRNLAIAYEETQNYEEAIKSLNVLYTDNQADMEIVNKLIDLYMEVNEYKKLKKLLAKVIKRGKVDTDIYYTYALVSAKTGDVDGAVNLFKKVILLDPNNPLPHKDLGVIYLAQKLFDYARDEFSTAYNLAPNNSVMVFEYATFLYQVHEYAEAEPLYEKALKLSPKEHNYNLYAGLNYLQLNKLDKAKFYLEKVYKNAPTDSVIAFSLARIYYLQKNFEAAKQILIGLSSFNNDLEILNLFALISFELKEFEEAKIIYKKIAEMSPSSPNIIMQLAKCEIALNNKDEALDYLNQYLELIPDSEEANALIWKIS